MSSGNFQKAFLNNFTIFITLKGNKIILHQPLMCTKHEFEIKHASETHFIMKTQPEIYKSKYNPEITNNLMISFQFRQGINVES